LHDEYTKELVKKFQRDFEHQLLSGDPDNAKITMGHNPIPPPKTFRQRLWPMSICGAVPCRSICDPWDEVRLEPRAGGGVVPPTYIEEMLKNLGTGRWTLNEARRSTGLPTLPPSREHR